MHCMNCSPAVYRLPQDFDFLHEGFVLPHAVAKVAVIRLDPSLGLGTLLQHS